MSIAVGTRLGPYEILAMIGAGGMGEVYRARDSRLGRDVAIKTLSTLQAARPDLRQRFEQEARTISNLQHPYICTVFDIGQQDGVDYLVMEHLEGETLEKRLERGPLPFEQAIRYAIQIADAVDKAHRHGVIHRDLKPGNIMLTKTGAKLLDFGLAKLRPDTAPITNRSILPTNAAMTAEGTILGTLQYMAPEQIEAEEPDARTDIFAFGAVLYEMFTAKRAFEGKSQASLIAAIIDRQPTPISEVRQIEAPEIDHLVQGCLAKNRDERWQSAYDVLKQLKTIAEKPPQSAAAKGAGGVTPRQIAFVAVVLVVLAVAAFFAGRRLSTTSDGRPLWVSIPPPYEQFNLAVAPAISPDGQTICFTAPDPSGKSALWVRPLNSGVARSLPETEDAVDPFWSPDGRTIGFFQRGKLKRIDDAGGSAQELADAPNPRGGAWGPNGVVLFVPTSGAGIFRVSASGGPATPITKLDATHKEVRHGYPSFLPDGDHFLYWTRSGDPQYMGTYVGSLATPDFKHRVANWGYTNAEYREGYILFGRNGNLFAQSFDLKSFDVSGEPQRIAENAGAFGGFSLVGISASEKGVLVYPTGPVYPVTQFTSFDREGRNLGVFGPTSSFSSLALSPDEKQISSERFEIKDNSADVWIVEPGGALSRLTSSLDGSTPLWSPDGQRILYSRLAETFHIRSVRSTEVEDLPPILPNTAKWPISWSPDGQSVLFIANDPVTSLDVWMLPLTGDRKPSPYANSKFTETSAKFSPDGRWVAFVSDEAGRTNVYVDSFPKPGNRVRVSTNGGEAPEWRRDGKELFFIATDGKFTSATIGVNANGLTVTAVRPLFQAPNIPIDNTTRAMYAVAENGNRFVFNTIVPGAGPRGVNVVINWPAILKK